MRSTVVVVTIAICSLASCTFDVVPDLPFQAGSESTETCTFIAEGYGEAGDVDIEVETVVSGLETPWSLAFLPDGDMLVTERPGRLRIVDDGVLVPEPVAVLEVEENTNEGGLLGLVLHPDFEENRLFYLYVMRPTEARPMNRVERWRLDDDGRSASLVEIIVDDIRASTRHAGGRMRFGPDGMLYISTGESGEPELAQDLTSLAGKILRVTADGDVPADNPFEGSPVYILGVRNSQGFDFFEDGTLAVIDHGPTGDLLRTGGDEVNVAEAADNLGWPDTWQCEEEEGFVSPVLVFDEALPPASATFYTGDAIPEWRGALVIGVLGVKQLQVVHFDEDTRLYEDNAIYLEGELGRLRDVVMGPDGDLYVTTSNCDGRGECPPEGDLIVRVTR